MWKSIAGHEYRYDISTEGEVWDTVNDRELKQTKVSIRKGQSPKYFRVSLAADGVRKSQYVHILMLETFVGQRPAGAESRHLNDDGFDNRLENLVWGTQSENNKDRVANGIHHYARRVECKFGHEFDGHNGKQRTCSQCQRKNNREKKIRLREARQTCPQGHEFDGVRLNADGTVRQRYCTRCVNDQLAQGRKNRNITECPNHHPLDGVYLNRDGTVRQRYCKTCKLDQKRARTERQRQGLPPRPPGRPRKE
jgi:hypothetical protein